MLNGINTKIKVHVVPTPGNFPRRGGVREHIVQLYNCIGSHPRVCVARDEEYANIVHVESSYMARHRKPDVYVCHGGFEPPPTLDAVKSNLEQAKVIVSVAGWLVDKYFPQYKHKTVVIPNGVNLDEWKDVPPSGIEPGYILYAKEWPYYMADFIRLAELMPKQRFVSTVWPDGVAQLENVEVIGLQSREVIRSVLKDAAALMLSGPEVCPTMLLEAWACKTPVIAKMVAGSAEIMLNNDTPGIQGGGGYHTDCGLESVGFIEYVLASSKEFGEQGYEQVITKYQWQDLFEEYVRLYAAIEYHELETYFSQEQTIT